LRLQLSNPTIELGCVEGPDTEDLGSARDIGRAKLDRADTDAEAIGHLATTVSCFCVHCRTDARGCLCCAALYTSAQLTWIRIGPAIEIAG
jgi:hypothetical protein